MKEIWKIVKRYPSVEISNLGNVRHLSSKEAIEVVNCQIKGMCFKLYEDDSWHNVAKLMAETFIEGFDGVEMKVMFKDENWKNVTLENLIAVPKKNSKLTDAKSEYSREDRQRMTFYFNDPYKLFIRDSKAPKDTFLELPDEEMHKCKIGKFDCYMSKYGRVWRKLDDEFYRIRPQSWNGKDYILITDEDNKKVFFSWNYLVKVLNTLRTKII